MERISDFRSDTITLPTPAMRQAMMNAAVGDDVAGEDPTVRELERRAAERIGKEAALFVTSGTQGNLVAVLTHTNKGDEVILEAESHIFYYEVGGMSALAGVIPRPVPGKDGVLSPDLIHGALRGDNIHFPKSTLLCLENSHNRGGGAIWSVSETEAACAVAKAAGLRVHLDGARIFNAALAQGCDVKQLAAPVDSVMFCLSKGLGAPVGSILAGSSEFISRARKWRKMLGGGMRQAGVLAAAGLTALNDMVDRLIEDHVLAGKIGRALAVIPGLSVELESLRTNIVVAQIDQAWGSAERFLTLLRQEGVMGTDFGPQTARFVTHKDVGEEDAEKLIAAVRKVMSSDGLGV